MIIPCIFKKNSHAIIFTVFGLYITGFPLFSARWYLAYLIGLVLVWTLPFNKNIIGYFVLAIGVIFKAYVGYITPEIKVQTIPIAMYKSEFIQHHPNLSKELSRIMVANLDVDVLSKNNEALQPTTSNSPSTNEPILYDFKIGSNFVDRSKIWTLPVNVQTSNVPVILALKVNQADHGIVWLSDSSPFLFFEQKTDLSVSAHSENGIALKNHIGSTLFFPLINYPNKPSWIYIELLHSATYLPLLLIMAAVLLVNFKSFSSRTLEHSISLTFAFITICTSDIHPNWQFCSFPYDKLHSLSNWVHGNIWDINAGQAPLWYLVNKLFYPISYFGYLLPILCFWAAALLLLQLLRDFFKTPHSYIIWGILLTTPWLAKQGIGLHVYKPLNIVYSSIMLGLPLFLIGLLGYISNFKLWHGLAWVAASLCNPVIATGVSMLLLHKHIGRHRFVYLGLCLGLYGVIDYNNILNIDCNNPLTAWLLTKSKDNLDALISFMTMSYQPFFIAFGLIPNIYMAFNKDIKLQRFARSVLIMHSGFILSASIPQEAYIACTLSAICTLIYLAPYYERFINQHQLFTAKSQ